MPPHNKRIEPVDSAERSAARFNKPIRFDIPVKHDPRSEDVARKVQLVSDFHDKYVHAADLLFSKQNQVEPSVRLDYENPFFCDAVMHRIQFIVHFLRKVELNKEYLR